MHTGTAQFIRPSLGAWTLYGLGTENESLPGFVSLSPPSGTSRNYGSSFLPAIYGGSKVGNASRGGRGARSSSGRVCQTSRIRHFPNGNSELQLELIQALNREKIRRDKIQPGVEGVIESYELAFRMQDAMPALMNTAKETQETLAMYGADGGPSENFGRQCLLARRFVEAGVRFVEVTQGGWDQHTNLTVDHKSRAEACDKAIAGLLQDLQQRDMLKDTLVIWGGEFGRTPAAQEETAAITTTEATRPGWPEAGSKGASATERPTNTATKRSRRNVTSTIGMRRFCTFSVWITQS